MPDAAFEATERQFTELLRAATPQSRVVLLKLFAIPEVPRGEEMRRVTGRQISRHRRALGYAARRLDRHRHRAARQESDRRAILGNSERGRRLGEGPYRLDHLVVPCRACGRAAQPTASSAARCTEKQFGVFDCRLAADHPMTQHFPEPLWVPHSRYNELPEEALLSAGYKILTRSATRRRRCFRQAGRQLLSVLPGPSGIRRRHAVPRISPRRGALPRAASAPTIRACRSDYFDDVATALAEAFPDRAIADRRGDADGGISERGARGRPANAHGVRRRSAFTKNGSNSSAPARRNGARRACDQAAAAAADLARLAAAAAARPAEGSAQLKPAKRAFQPSGIYAFFGSRRL